MILMFLMSRPTLGLTCAAGGHVKRDERRHETRMQNAPGLRPRQRRQVQAMLGRGFAYAVCPVVGLHRTYLRNSPTWCKMVRHIPRRQIDEGQNQD